MKTLKKVFSILLTAACVACAVPQTAVPAKAADNTRKLLEEYAGRFKYLRDSSTVYHGTYAPEWNSENDYWIYTKGGAPDGDEVPTEEDDYQMGYQIADFDNDGQDELFTIGLFYKRPDDDYTCGYTLRLSMYEVQNSKVTLTRRYFPDIDGSFNATLGSSEDTASFNCFTAPVGGKLTIFLEEDSFAYVQADGKEYNFDEIRYNGKDFYGVFRDRNAGSSVEEDLYSNPYNLYNGLLEYHKIAGINVDYAKTYCFDPIYKYIDHKTFIAGADRRPEGNREEGYTESNITFGTRSAGTDKLTLVSDKKYKSLLSEAEKDIPTKPSKASKNAAHKLFKKIAGKYKTGKGKYLTVKNKKGKYSVSIPGNDTISEKDLVSCKKGTMTFCAHIDTFYTWYKITVTSKTIKCYYRYIGGKKWSRIASVKRKKSK